ELPDHEPIAGPQVGQGPLQGGPLGFGPAGLVGVDLLAARGLQGIFLEVEVLIEGRDPGVADPHRAGPPAVPRSPLGLVSQLPVGRASRETWNSSPCSAHLSEYPGFKGLAASRFLPFRRANWHRYLNGHKKLRREIRTRCAESPFERCSRDANRPSGA